MSRFIRRLVKFIMRIEVDYDSEMQQVADRVRDISKEFLELIRNLTVVSAITFFATRTDSWALHAVAGFGTFLIGMTVITRLAPYSLYHKKLFRGFSRNSYLVLLLTTLAFIVIYSVLKDAIALIVNEIVRSQIAH
jgi:F0F1-type ATP synthase assembly protein I